MKRKTNITQRNKKRSITTKYKINRNLLTTGLLLIMMIMIIIIMMIIMIIRSMIIITFMVQDACK